MQIYSIQSFSGKNIYSHRPVIKMVIDLGDFHDVTTNNLGNFNDKILELFPGLRKHYCSLGYEGGFAERLKEGTYLGHVSEHLILELQSMMGYEVFYGKTRMLKEPGLYYMVYEFVNERCGMECGRAGVDIVSRLASNKEVDIGKILADLRKITVESELGPSTKAIYDEAKKRGIPVSRIGNGSLIQLGYGKYSRLVEASLTDALSCISVDIAGNKHLTKQKLMENNIPVPYGDVAYTEEGAVQLAKSIGFPVVLKPFDANQGKGVTVNIWDDSQVKTAYHEALKYGRAVIVENYIKGKDFRVLVVGGKVSAVAERRPPSVTGDGVHTVKELVDSENSNPLRGDDHEKPLTKIKLDIPAKQVLSRQGLDENSIPAPGEIVRLRDNGNLSTGGTARDCTDEIHPYNSMLAVKAAKSLGLDVAGVDIVAEDISKPINTVSQGAVIEVNAAPGLRMHLCPSEGNSRNVAADIVDMLYPAGKPCSIPVVSVTGTNGKTTTTRLIRHTLALTGKKIGMTSTSGVYIGNECILKGDNTGPFSARMVLSNREVEAAVLETARGGIIKRGLGYDLADVGVIVNISDDHIGLDGIDTLEDLAFVKSLVVEAVKPEGYSVLNADDLMTNRFLERAAGRIIFFSSQKSNSLVINHIKNGGTAVYVKNQSIYICSNKKEKHLIKVHEIPITFDGMVDCNVENSLAAVSALYALNLPLEIIRMGLKTFKPDVLLNPGRFNIFDMGCFKVMLDYGHNAAGYNAVLNFVRKMNATRLVGIIGVPGDRINRNIREVGKICSKAFSKIYIKEDNDLRGRQPGEVAHILYESVMEEGMEKENVEIIYSELKALETAMLDAQPGDLIVMLYEEFEPAVEMIGRFRQELEQNTVQAAIAIENTVG
ncbi:MAG: cyanophycin synthetase [Clostridiales bacterium]|nr:cyanophycin synthetase [Eubacteriales bacterium]MDH7566121.1 cyanophycin synthetase [Clostridiales bacterium]